MAFNTFSRSVCLLLGAILLLCFVTTEVSASRFHAAKCIKASSSCSRSLARKSDFVCKAGRKDVDQPFRCRKLACKWCDLPRKINTPLCATRPLSWMCARLRGSDPKPSSPPAPAASKSPKPSKQAAPTSSPKTIPVDGSDAPPSPRPSPTNQYPQEQCRTPSTFYSANCVWQMRGNDIVVDLDKVRPPQGWTCIKRGPFRGWIYEKSKNLGIDPAGQLGKQCFTVRPEKDGDYTFTAMSYSPHGSEHNDMWVNSPDYGFALWKFGTFWKTVGPNRWLKAYQNNGPRGIIDQLKTKDFDGHRFIIPNVQKGKNFRVCISGRSYKYEVYRIYVIKCYGIICTGVPLKNLIENRQPTQCK